MIEELWQYEKINKKLLLQDNNNKNGNYIQNKNKLKANVQNFLRAPEGKESHEC